MDHFSDAPLTDCAAVLPEMRCMMWLTRIEPDRRGFARRTFECPRCQTKISELVELEKASELSAELP